jgi:hypothetical protein
VVVWNGMVRDLPGPPRSGHGADAVVVWNGMVRDLPESPCSGYGADVVVVWNEPGATVHDRHVTDAERMLRSCVTQ